MNITTVFAALATALLCNATPPYCADSRAAANTQLVKDFLRDIRRAAATDDPARIRAVVERYMTVDYVQHAPDVAPGRGSRSARQNPIRFQHGPHRQRQADRALELTLSCGVRGHQSGGGHVAGDRRPALRLHQGFDGSDVHEQR
jgi:hypothetical protein